MNFCEVLKSDMANGPGMRVSLFVAGCRHHCKGCFNPQTWAFDAGAPFTGKTAETILAELANPWVHGLTLLGGEPMEPVNQRGLLPLLRELRRRLPEKDVWCYTGCVLEKDLLAPDGAWRCEATDELLAHVDVLVDGPFVEELKDISLLFRGSSNQRLLANTHGPRGFVPYEGT